MICWAAHCGRCPSRDAIRSKVPHTAPPTTRIGEEREASSSPPALSVRRPDLYSAPILPSGADTASWCGVHVDDVLLTSFPIGFSRAKRDFAKPGRRLGAVRDTVEAQSTGFSKNTPRRASSIRSPARCGSPSSFDSPQPSTHAVVEQGTSTRPSGRVRPIYTSQARISTTTLYSPHVRVATVVHTG